MFDFIDKYWHMLTSILIAYGWLLRLSWKLDSVSKKRHECEMDCDAKINNLKIEYSDDFKELKADLKENVRLSQNINLSLASLTSFLHGKGFTIPE